MATEPFMGYIPEINAGRFEGGPGPLTWVAGSNAYLAYAAELQVMASQVIAQTAAMVSTLQGATSAAMATSSTPFWAWLEMAMAKSLAKAASYSAVAAAYGGARGTMQPLVAVNANRVAEAQAEATNIFGINSGLIAALNAQYAQMHVTNGGTMETFDELVQTATTPTPIPPPPEIGSEAATAAGAGETAAITAANSVQGAAFQATQQSAAQLAQQSSTQSATPADASSSLGSMTGILGSVASAPSSLLGGLGSLTSLPQTLLSPVQAAASPALSMISQFSQPNMTGMDKLTGYTPNLGGAFMPTSGPGSTGGLPLGSGAGGMGGLGGGYSGASLSSTSQGAYATGSLNGAGTAIGGLTPALNNASGAGAKTPVSSSPGGMGGGAPHGAGAKEKKHTRGVVENISPSAPVIHAKPSKDRVSKMFA